MFKLFTTEKAFIYKLLSLFLLLVLIFGAGSHYAGLGSDPYGIVHFARHLARGKFFSDYPVYGWFKTDWEPGRAYFVLHGNYLLRDGRLYCKYTIGYPLILALSSRLFGENSVYFLNVIILLFLLWFFFKLGEVIFSYNPRGLFLALFGPFFLLILIDQVWGLALRPSRDLSALMFLITGFFLGVYSLKKLPRINYSLLLLGSFCLGFSANIRLPNILAVVPGGLYLLAKPAGKISARKLTLLLLAAAFCFGLALTPTFFQNQLATGNPLKPPRPEIVERDPLKVIDEPTPPPLWIGFFRTTAPDTLRFFFRLYGPVFIFLILLGLVSNWRSPEVKYLCLGVPLIFILFYSMWVHLMTRYMLIAQPFLILLIAAGCGKLLQIKERKWVLFLGPVLIGLDIWMRWRMKYAYGMEKLNYPVLAFALGLWILAGWGRKTFSTSSRFVLLSLLLLGLFLFKIGPTWFHSGDIFQLPEARRFGRDFDRLVEKGSVVFATKPISQYISLFTRSYGIRPFEMKRVGVDTREGVLKVMDREISLYLIDNNSWKRDAGKSIPLFREYFDVIPVGKLWADRYNLREKFGRPVCTVYKIEPWSEKEVEFEVRVPSEEEDYILRLNPGHLWNKGTARRRVMVELNGQPLKINLRNNINYLLLPSPLLTAPLSSLRISSDQPLPREMDLRLQDLGSDYRVDLGTQLSFPDKFVRDRFDEARLRDAALVRLGWSKPGAVSVPTVKLPDTELVGEIKVRRVRDFPYPMGLRIILNGEEIADLAIPAKTEWELIRFPLPAEFISSVQSELDFLAYPRRGNEISVADNISGALFFENVKIKRYLRKTFLPTPDPGPYFLAFPVEPGRGEAECPPPYLVLVNQKQLRSGVEGGVERLILTPAEISCPLSELEVVSADKSCVVPLAPGPFLRPMEPELVIDIGGEEDWAFIRSGFYERELHLGRTPVRWTEQTARLALPLFPRRGKKLLLSLKVAASGPPRRGRETAAVFELNGRRIGEISLKAGEGIYRLPLPLDPEKPQVATLTIRTPPWQPSRYLGTADKRKLGIMLDWLKVGYYD